eukprot:8386094-Lingulodinium_polyedra.AAC.1
MAQIVDCVAQGLVHGEGCQSVPPIVFARRGVGLLACCGLGPMVGDLTGCVAMLVQVTNCVSFWAIR